MPNSWRRWHTGALVVLVVAIGAVGFVVPAESRRLGWFLTMALMVAFLVILGLGFKGRWEGALIDDRNMMSLSRFQIIAWTVLTLSAFLTAALGNLVAGLPDPLAVAIPEDLWWLMGISTTSLVASPLLKATKKSKEADDDETTRANLPRDRVEGLLVLNTDPGQAHFSDMFRGEEIANSTVLDVAKVQMFYFTVILVIAYGASLATAMGVFPITELPDMSGGMVALLGISHAGYLTGKSTTQTKVMSVPDSTTSAPRASRRR